MTIYSMTGYAIATKEVLSGSLNIELRTVNSRYLDIQFRISDEFRPLEPAIRELIAAQINRGKIECRLNFTARSESEHPEHLNLEFFKKLVKLNQSIQSSLPEAQSLSVADILNWPGILVNNTNSMDCLHDDSLMLLKKTLQDLTATRKREGKKLKIILLDRLEQIRALITNAQPYIPGLITAFEEKLRNRLIEADINQEDERIRQEISLFAGKIDIDEELSRLQTHLDEVERILYKGGTVGKRLDFMMQELNREANTVGSKSIDLEITKISMALKVLIEQMREQIQNIE